MPNTFLVLTGFFGLALLFLSLGRVVSWTLDTPRFGVLQDVLHYACWISFIFGLAVEVTA